MPALQVREFPEDIYARLRLRAQQEHRSISQQTIIAIEEHLLKGGEKTVQDAMEESPVIPFPSKSTSDDASLAEAPESHVEKRMRLFEKINARPAFEIPDGFPDIVDIIQEMRDDR